jgi:deoxyribonuclease V
MRILDSDGRLPRRFPKVPSTVDLDDALTAMLALVPRGRVTTPGALASGLGDPSAARFVGGRLTVLRDRDAPGVFRVVLSSGEVPAKPRVLSREGVRLKDGKVEDLAPVLFDDFGGAGGRPLKKLVDYQRRAAKDVSLKGPAGDVGRVAGVDVSYVRGSDEAVACATVTDPAGKEVLEQVAVRTRVRFPYISGYLGFREVPPFASVLRALKSPPDVVLVDGHGVLHPRRFGVACQLGVALDVPAVGCAKRVLVGRPSGRSEALQIDGERLGWALRPDMGSRPAIVSPAHRVGVERARRLVTPLLRHQMPEPIRRSHIGSGAVLRER